jgi:2-(3-amino-3-carboxypropyl)histidine synthase
MERKLNIDFERIFSEIWKRKAILVGLQFPEGLKTRAKETSETIEQKTKAKTLIFIEPSFGACMLADNDAKRLGCDLLVHFGHSRFYKEEMPTVFVPVFYEIPEQQIKKTANKIATELQKRKIKKTGLVGTIQYAKALPEIKKELEKKGFSVKIGKGNNVSDGQVLGCNYSAPVSVIKDVEATIYIGDGRFHPLAIVLGTNQPVFSIEPFELEFRETGNEKEKFVRKRMALTGSLMESKSFGILVSTEKGQSRIRQALAAKEAIEQQGKKALILTGRLLKPEYMLGIKVDCLVNTACPRIATDDYANYPAPVISLNELPFVLGTKKLEEFDSKTTI